MQLSTIHAVVCEHYKVEKEYIFRRTRKREVVEMRQIFYYLCKKFTKNSLESIGQYYSEVSNNIYNHVTVRHAKNNIEGLLESNWDIRENVADITNILESIKTSTEVGFSTTKEELIKIILDTKTFGELIENLKTKLHEIEDGQF